MKQNNPKLDYTDKPKTTGILVKLYFKLDRMAWSAACPDLGLLDGRQDVVALEFARLALPQLDEVVELLAVVRLQLLGVGEQLALLVDDAVAQLPMLLVAVHLHLLLPAGSVRKALELTQALILIIQ